MTEHAQVWPHRRWGIALISSAVGFLTFWVLSSADRPAPTELVPVRSSGTPPQAMLIFVDSLRDDVAQNAKLMPTLASLAASSTTFIAEPCRDRLTYLCLQATFTGRDESSLLSIRKNFHPTQEGAGVSLFDVLRRAGAHVTAFGSDDLSRWERAFAESQYVDAEDETVEIIGERWRIDWRDGRRHVGIVGLLRGDQQSHVHPFGSEPYNAAWKRVDDILALILSRIPEDVPVLIFGDHGHDAAGRHLPGLECDTYALYRGAPFRGRSPSRIALSDHRAILGVLLGVDTPATYQGPPLEEIFTAEWIRTHYPDGLPAVAGEAPPALSVASRWAIWGGLIAGACALLWLLGLRGPVLLLPPWAGVTGLLFNDIRMVIHDHGDSPERALFLIVPLGLGLALGWVWKALGRMTAARMAAGVTIVPFLLLFPSANYYGAPRAIVFGGYAAVAVIGVALWRSERLKTEIGAWLAGALALLITFYDVSRRGGGTGLSTYDFSSPIYDDWAVFSLPVLLGLLCGALERTQTHSPRRFRLAWWGTALAVVLVGSLAASGWAEQVAAGVLLPGGLLVAWLCWRRSAALAAVGLVVALLVMYPPSRVCGMVGITLCLVSFRQVILGLVEREWVTPSAFAIPFALTAYLMLWPSLGFRLSGIDFGFVFRWVPVARYEELWWVFVVGTALKLAIPYVLLVRACQGWFARGLSVPLLPAKVLLLSCFGMGYAIRNSFVSRFSLDVLSELGLVFVVAASLIVSGWIANRHGALSPD